MAGALSCRYSHFALGVQSGKTPLHRAKTPEVVRILVDAGASLGVIDKVRPTDVEFPLPRCFVLITASLQDGNTPLHAVAARGKMDAYDALVAAGADERVLNQVGLCRRPVRDCTVVMADWHGAILG